MRILSLALLLAGAGCSSISVWTDHDPQADFSKRKTYDWYPRAKEADAVVTLTNARVERALEESLKARGFTRSSDGKADFHVGYRALVQRRSEAPPTTDVSVYHYGWRRTYTVTADSEAKTTEEGTLILDVIDPATKTLLWRGTARGVVDPTRTPEQREARIREAVEKLLADFPPGR